MRAWTWGYDLYQPDRNVIGHLYIPSGSPLRPVFWTTDWGKRWPCQPPPARTSAESRASTPPAARAGERRFDIRYRSLLRVQEQLGIHRELTPRAPPRRPTAPSPW